MPEVKQKRTYRRDPSKKRKPRTDRGYAVSRRMVFPSVAAATCEELVAAGWGGYERHQIIQNWRTEKPKGMVKRGPKGGQDEFAGPVPA